MSKQKEKFFAQYWGQEVAVWNDIFGTPKRYIGTEALNATYLELTPLSQISDEDLEAIGFGNIGDKKLQFVFDNYDTHWKSSCGNWGTLLLKDFDYLRSKGYGLPWNGITVEEQIKRGWIKLKDNE